MKAINKVIDSGQESRFLLLAIVPMFVEEKNKQQLFCLGATFSHK